MSGYTGVSSEGVLRLWDLIRLCSKEHHSVAFSAGFQIVSVLCDLAIKIYKCQYSKYHKKEKDGEIKGRWSDLDREILEHVLRRLCHRDSLRFGSVCSWWRTVQAERIYPSTHFPWILLPNQNLDSQRRTLYSPSDGVCFEICVPPKALGKLHLASYHGWMLMVDQKNVDHPFLFNPYSGGQVELPEIGFDFGMLDAYLSSDPSDPDCIVAFPMFLGSQLMLCRVGVGDTTWTEYTGDLNSICSMACCRGQLYCIDAGQNLMTLDLGVTGTDTGTTIVLVPMQGGKHPLMTATGWEIMETEHAMLVESCGELLMVLLYWEGVSRIISTEPNIAVQVFRADFSKMAWVKVESLGDRVLFMGSCCSTSFSAADIGGQGNHVYFSYRFNLGILEGCYWCWLDFDLGSGKARHLIPPREQYEAFLHGRSFWVAPDYLHGRISNSVNLNPSTSSWVYGVHDLYDIYLFLLGTYVYAL